MLEEAGWVGGNVLFHGNKKKNTVKHTEVFTPTSDSFQFKDDMRRTHRTTQRFYIKRVKLMLNHFIHMMQRVLNLYFKYNSWLIGDGRAPLGVQEQKQQENLKEQKLVLVK